MKLKKLLALCLSMALLFTAAMPMTAFADDDDDKDYTISDLYWDLDEDRAMARWEKAESKTGYKVQLYKVTSSSYKKISSLKSTSSDHFDFTSIIINEGSGTYYFIVYPAKGGTDMAQVSDSLKVGSGDSYDISLSTLKNSTAPDTSSSSSSSGGPGVNTPSKSQTSVGWHRAADGIRWWYQENESSYAANKWLYINNQWYHFDAAGYMQTGWFQNTATDNQWYYLDPINGNMLTNTVIDGHVIDGNGIWVH